MEDLKEYIIKHITLEYVVFRITEHMIKNSEMNATSKIRSFFEKTNYINYDNIQKGDSIRNPIILLSNGQKSTTTISLKKPPSKDESRMWIFELGDHIEPNDEVLLLFLNKELTAIPLNQNLKDVVEFLRSSVKTQEFEFSRIDKLDDDPTFKAKKVDFIEIAKRNQILGLEGELFVIAYEQLFLESIGREDLSSKIEHKSVTEGDGLGFDVLSFDKNGKPKHIEVKTTIGNANAQFYMTQNELSFMEINPATYYIYRVYDFNREERTGKVVVLNNSIMEQIDLIPNSFRCKLKNI